MSTSRPPAVMLTRSSVRVKLPPVRLSAGPFSVSWPVADEIESPVRADTMPPVRSSSAAVPVSVREPDTATRLPILLTSAPMVRSRLPPIVLGLVELTRKPVAPPRFSAPPASAVNGAAPGAVSVAPLDTSTKAEPVRVNVLAEASSTEPARVAADPVPVTTKS